MALVSRSVKWGTAIFVSLRVEDPATSSYVNHNFSDYYKEYSLAGLTFEPLGSLLSVSPVQDDLRARTSDLSIEISGVPSANVTLAFNTNLKGSQVKLWRGFYNLEISPYDSFSTTPELKFQGIVNNVGFTEQYKTNESEFTISFICTSEQGILLNQPNGRRTNKDDVRTTPDLCFDRVNRLKNSNFNFGAPNTVPRLGTK